MLMIKKLNLQMFAEDENPKTFTQEELDKTINERLAREKEKAKKELELQKAEFEKQRQELEEQKQAFEQEKNFKDLDEAQRKEAEFKLKTEQMENEIKKLREERLVMERHQRGIEVIESYGNDKLPNVSGFTQIANLFSNIDDVELRADMFSKFKEYIVGIETSIKTELLKQKSPDSGKGTNKHEGGNPFKGEPNLGAIGILIKTDPEKAKSLAVEAGNYEKYAKYFN